MTIAHGVSEVEEALKAAAAAQSEAAESDEKTASFEDDATGSPEPRRKGKNPNVPDGFMDRFNEVNEAKKLALEKVSDLEDKLVGYRNNTLQLQDKLNYFSNLVENIRSLKDHDNDQVRKAVILVDKALKKELDDIGTAIDDSAKEASEQGQPDVKKALLEQKKELQNLLLDERFRATRELAEDRASRYLAQLPAEYTDDHKRVISRLWNSEVNWELLQQDPEALNGELLRSLKSVIEEYPYPGRDESEDDDSLTRPPAKEEQDPAAELKRLLDTDWGAMDKNGKPLVTDDQFNAISKRVIQLQRQLDAKQ
jgi:hypothetical protein